MSSLNQCNFIGRVGKIETRYMPSEESVTNISLAVNETWKDKQGEKQERVEWVRGVIFKKLSEIAEKYVKVGDLLYISGKMQTKSYEKDGITRYSTEIFVNEMKMLGGKPDAKTDSNPSKQAESKARPVQPKLNNDNFEDDIPFN